jgi:hypothetical protein
MLSEQSIDFATTTGASGSISAAIRSLFAPRATSHFFLVLGTFCQAEHVN